LRGFGPSFLFKEDTMEDYRKYNLDKIPEVFGNKELNLHLLSEECSEVIQIICKIKRFGLDFKHPRTGETNLTELEKEIGDVMAIVAILLQNGQVSGANVDEYAHAKLHKLEKYYGMQDSIYPDQT
jgi:NTP pyrophosphatase (non-canonical NTP hydrolase)